MVRPARGMEPISRDAVLCLNELGEAELRIGDYVTAENFVARAFAIDPTDSTAQQLRQQILQRKGGAN
jgi:Flp pilus assembly protein TadD